MKRMMAYFLSSTLFLTAFTLWGAKKTYYVNILLEKVTRQSLVEDETLMPTGLSFSDDLIQITWNPKPQKIEFILKNISSKSISIVWQDSYFIDRDNVRHEVIPSTIKPDKMQDPVPPVEIPAGSKLDDWFFPKGYYARESKQEPRTDISGRMTHSYTVTEWVKRPIYIEKEKLKKPDDFDFAAYKSELEKNTFEVILFLKSGLDTFEYHHFFKPDVKEK